MICVNLSRIKGKSKNKNRNVTAYTDADLADYIMKDGFTITASYSHRNKRALPIILAAGAVAMSGAGIVFSIRNKVDANALRDEIATLHSKTVAMNGYVKRMLSASRNDSLNRFQAIRKNKDDLEKSV